MPLALPHDASLDGFRIDRLIALGAWVQFPLLVLLALWLIGAAVVWGRRHAAVSDRGTWRDGRTHLPAVGLSLVALLLLVGLDALSWSVSNHDLDAHFWNYAAPEADPRTLRIELDAHQWAWAGRYAGPDGVFGTADDAVTLNDLRIPVDTPILLEMISTDVIHDFYLPNFRLKQDVIPGRTTRLTFTARETGRFEIACSQFCGLNHYKMRGVLTVLSADDYRHWLERASAESRALYDPENSVAHWGWPWLSAAAAPRQSP